MKKRRGEVWINGKQARGCLAVNPLPYTHHLAGKFKLVLFTPHMLDGRIRKSQIKRLVGKRYLTGRCLDVVKAARIYRRQNIQNRDTGRASNHLPCITASANIQNGPARLIIRGEILEALLLKIPPQRVLKLNWIHGA